MRNRKRSGALIALFIAVITVVAVCLTACGSVQAPTGGGNNNNNNNNNNITDNTDKYCSVVFFVNEGSAVPPQTVKVGDRVTRPADPIRTDYVFGGWYSDSAFKNAWNFDSATAQGDTLVLYAMWTPVGGGQPDPIPQLVTVTFVTDCSAVVPPQLIEVGNKVAKPNITNAGYTLNGWYNGSTQWNFDTDTVSGTTLTLTAKWTKIDTPIIGTGDDVTVTFNVGLAARKAGTYNPAAVTVKAGSTITAPALTRAGYEVSGWYEEEDDTKKWDFATDKVTENVTLFAKWQAGGGTAIDYTPTMTNANTLYIHYLRSNGDYDGWYIYNWGNGNNQQIKNTVAKDASGAVFAINLKDSINNGLNTINIIVTQAGWNKDGDEDIHVVLANTQKLEGGSYHWYITQGNTANGTDHAVAVSGGGPTRQTEEKRASVGNVIRSQAQALPVMPTVSGWDEMGVGYQIFVASFCDSDGDGVGDLKGIISKLDYLKGLNVDVLWLTPIQSSNSYHGYDCYDYYSIDSKFGTNADYRRLVSEAHSRGMKIIMDLVVNHTSQQNEWFQKSKAGVIEEVTYQDGSKATVKYRDFYRWKKGSGTRYHSADGDWYFYSSFGGDMPELNYDYQPVREAMADVAAYWMSYGLDGFRMDAIKHVFMWDESENASSDVEGAISERAKGYNYNETKNVEFFKEFNYKLKTKYPHCFLLGEQLNGNTDDVAPFYQGMDSLFDFNTYYDLPQRINGSKGGAAEQASALNANATKYQTNRGSGNRPINGMISSNHDIPRLSYQLDGETDKMKLYMAVIMTMPGLTWIYYGDEIGLNGPDGNDKNYRQSMKWTSSWANECHNDISGKQYNSNTKSVADQEKDDSSLLSYVKSLTKFRNDNPALISGEATCSTQDGMLKISVTGGGKTYTVYHNFSNSSKTVSGTVLFGSSTVPAYGTAIVG